MYGIFLILTLGGLVWSQAGLLYMTANMNKNLKIMNESISTENAKKEYERTFSQLILTLCSTQIFSCFISFIFFVFGSKNLPSPQVFFLYAVPVEIADAFGQVILVTRVLPSCNSVYNISLLNSVSLIPSFLRLFIRNDEENDQNNEEIFRRNRYRKLAIDGFAFAIQAGSILGSAIFIWGADDSILKNENLYWMTPLSLILCSIKLWENFSDGFSELRSELKNTRNFTNIFLTIIHIGSVIGFGYLTEAFIGPNIAKPFNFHPFSDTSSYVSIFWTPVISFALGAAMAYYYGSLSIKVEMHKFSFNIPLFLSTIMVLLLVLLQSYDKIPYIRSSDYEISFTSIEMSNMEKGFIYANIFLTWLSTICVGRHVFKFKTNVLAKREDIFIFPLYNVATISSNLLLNLRRISKEEWKELKSIYQNLQEQKNEQNNEKENFEDALHRDLYRRVSEPNIELPDRKDVKPRISVYACATMWHETRNEMMQLMKSIFRMDYDYAMTDEFQSSDKKYFFESKLRF